MQVALLAEPEEQVEQQVPVVASKGEYPSRLAVASELLEEPVERAEVLVQKVQKVPLAVLAGTLEQREALEVVVMVGERKRLR